MPKRLAAVGLLFALAITGSAQNASDNAQPSTPDATQPAEPSKLPPVKTSITVTEQVQADSPQPITVLDQTQIQSQPGMQLDDRLRAIPGFTLFRRTSSIVAHPTTQGVSLRGIGSSGASRTLVLWDGVPINDPFGGWVYWTRIDPEELDRVEVETGAPTSAFGDRAMSGTIALFSRPAEKHRLTAGFEAGNRNTQIVNAGYSDLFQGRWGFSFDGRAERTDGYYIVPANVRGAVDRPANVESVAGDVRLDYLGTADRVFLKFDALAEDRRNGTVLTGNSTGLGTVSGQYSHEWTDTSFSLTGYHTREQFHSSFSSVSADRNTERYTFLQTVPSHSEGGAIMLRHSEQRWGVFAGVDTQNVQGTDTDRLFPTGQRIGGGSQLQSGLFAEGNFTQGPFTLFAGMREQITNGQPFFRPNGGLRVGHGLWRGHVNGYRAFRAPTLNELYRDFRVGNALTRSNSALVPESLVGVEAGIEAVGERTQFSVTAFHNDLTNLISNVTLSSSPTLIVRQRQNAASAVAQGFEINARRTFGDFRLEAGYLYADSYYGTGPRLPQVPHNQGTGQITYAHGGSLFSAGVRAYSGQFDDDLNQFFLPGFAVAELMLRQHLVRGLSAIFAADNLLDRQFLVAYTPTPNIGNPRLWRVGLRWDGVLR